MSKQLKNKSQSRLARRKRMMAWTFLFMILSIMVLPLSGYVYTNLIGTAHAASQDTQDWQDKNPRANYWESVRKSDQGYTAVKGQETNVLIQNGGQNWRALRNGPVATYGGWLLILALIALGAFYIFKGQIKLDQPRSGKTVERWTVFERTMHWFTAGTFVLLAITGLSLIFGRAVLIPLFGKDGFAAFANLSKTVHDYVGPLFLVGVCLIFITWLKHNFFTKEDIQWFKQGGGIVGEGHPSAGRMNGGEKIWFWIVCIAGLSVSISGLVMDFPNFEQTRGTMQLANLIHGIFAIIFVAVAFGHIYIGTLGTEGALEGMVTGQVDETWAKQHHDQWYKEVTGQAGMASTSSEPPPGTMQSTS